MSCNAPSRSSSLPDRWQMSSAITRIRDICDWGLGEVLLFTPTQLGVSASEALGVFAKEARFPEIAPSVICHLVGNTSKLPELGDHVEGGISLGLVFLLCLVQVP